MVVASHMRDVASLKIPAREQKRNGQGRGRIGAAPVSLAEVPSMRLFNQRKKYSATRRLLRETAKPDFDSQRSVGTRSNVETIPNQRLISGAIAVTKWRSAKFCSFDGLYA